MTNKEPTFYHLVSTSRSVGTRVVRANNPTHAGLKQFIGGSYRLIRNRPLVLPEEELLAHLSEIRAKHAIGLLEVRTPDGRLVDLATLNPAPAPAAPPLPKPKLDSIADDDSWGQKMPNVPAGVPMQDVPELEGDVSVEMPEEEADIDFVEIEEEESVDEASKAPGKRPARKRRRRA